MTFLFGLDGSEGLYITLVAMLVATFCAVLHLREKYYKYYDRMRAPGPKGFPVIGSSHIIGRYPNVWDAFGDLRRQYGDVFALTLGSKRCLVVSSVEALREVLVAKAADFADRPDSLRYHAIFKGDRNLSIALCDWSSKQQLRRELAYSPMHPRQGSGDQDRLSTVIQKELLYLVSEYSQSVGTPVKPRQALLVATANIFYGFFCSINFSPEDDKFLRIIDLYNHVFHQLFQGFAIDFMPWLKIVQNRELCLLKEKSLEIFHFTNAILDARDDEPRAADGPRDLLDVLLISLDAPGSLLDRLDVSIIIEDLIGGHSVIANLWVWCLYILASHGEVQDKIRAEAIRAAGAEGASERVLTLADKPMLSFTESSVYEVIRIANSPIIPHVCAKDTTVQGFYVPKGTMVMFNTNEINYSAELWEEPWSFRPERFLNEDGTVSKPRHFFPFGTGKRSCMGDGIVRATLVLGLSTLLRHFRVTLAEDQKPANFASFRCKVIFDKDPKLLFEPTS
ncbi:unnamed protein product [Ixodes pacificus]